MFILECLDVISNYILPFENWLLLFIEGERVFTVKIEHL